MNIVFFAHPLFVPYNSIHRYTKMLSEGLMRRGHKVSVWRPEMRFLNLQLPMLLKKWLGYLDQYILFPRSVKKKLISCPADTLFVFTDNALGPWVHLVSDRPHVIHCHDFLAQFSALGMVPQNKTGWTGRKYQQYIKAGLSKGKNFISVSQHTRQCLHELMRGSPIVSEVVYNALSAESKPEDPQTCRELLARETGLELGFGYLLHVGGNQWYKNREGVIEIYNQWRAQTGGNLPLLMVGETPSSQLAATHKQSPFKTDIHMLSGITDQLVRYAYSGAEVMIFPSYAEGFGWPIAEAMASGCLVITTGESPMTEVAADAAFFIPRKFADSSHPGSWAKQSAEILDKVLHLSAAERSNMIAVGIRNAKRFDLATAIENIEGIYSSIH